MILSFINICKDPKGRLKTEGVADLGFQSSLGTLRMLMNGKSYLIRLLKKKVQFFLQWYASLVRVAFNGNEDTDRLIRWNKMEIILE